MKTMFPGESPRTRESDPLTSHLAGDRSQTTVVEVRAAVLYMLDLVEWATGSGLNELYRTLAKPHGWPEVHIDSPRKRAGELAREGYLTVRNEDAKRGHEHEYSLPERNDE